MNTQIRDNFKAAIGYVGEDGIIRDRFNMKIGSVDADGIVYDRFGMKNGSADETGVIYSRTGQKMGYIELDTGKIRAMTGLKVGSVKNMEATGVKAAGGAALVTLLLRLYDKRKTLVDG